MTITYQNLFPVAIGSTFLERDFTQTEIEFFNDQKNSLRPNISNRTSANSYIFENEILKEIKQLCEIEINKYFQEVYQPCNDVSLYITQSWINFTDHKQSHHQHTHANSFISGCLYLDVDKETDKITFHKPSSQLGVETKNYNIYNSNSWWLNVENKQLLMFPSNLAHSVEPTKSEKTRISIAFNTFFKGTLGSQIELTELKL